MSRPNLKYRDYLATLPSCPPAECSPCHLFAFRFVFTVPTKDSFVPAAIAKPRRRFKDDEENCAGFGLSFFDTAAKAESRFAMLLTSFPKLRQTVGDALAKVAITNTHGIASAPNGLGHFTLHEFETAQWNFEILKSL